MKKYIESEDILGNSVTVNDILWTPMLDRMNGVITWSSDDGNNVLYATPSWEEDGIIPFSYMSTWGDELTGLSISMVGLEELIELQIKIYISIIKEILA